ncbi:MAG: hypothetical protein AAF870_00260 [Pseudomonadota bacterium]
METLKFSILTLLIPLGWLILEVQDVDPLSFDQIDNNSNLNREPHHLERRTSRPNIEESKNQFRCQLENFTTHLALIDTKEMQQDRVIKFDVCHFNLDPIDIY